MECPRCHAELNERLRFCPACGYKVEEYIAQVLDGEQESDELEDEYQDEAVEEPAGSDETGSDETGSDDEAIAAEDAEEPAETIETDADEADEDDGRTDSPYADQEDNPWIEEEVVDEDVAPEVKTNETPVDVEMADVEAEPADWGDGLDVSEEDLAFAEQDTAQFRAISLSDDNAYTRADAYERGGIRGLIRRWKTVLICIACLIALVIAAVSSVEWNHTQDQVEAEAQAEAQKTEESRTPVEIGVQIDLPDYSAEHMTPIPLRVVGSAVTGDTVDELVLIEHPATDMLSLLKGTYIVSAAGPVLSNEGDLYEGTVDQFALAILDEGTTVNGKPVDAPGGKVLHFIYKKIEPQDVTDSEISQARAWMLKAEMVNYQAYTDTVANKRQEAIDALAAQQAAKEEADRRAAEEAAKKAEELKKKEEEQKNKEKEKDKDKESAEGSESGSSTNGDDSSSESGQTTENDGYGETGGYSDYDYGYDSSGYGYDDSYWV